MADARLPWEARRALLATAICGTLAIVLCTPSERLIGAMFEADGQFELAASYFLRWSVRYPKDYDSRFRAADLFLRTVHPERANQVLEDMARDFPGDPQILNRLVEIADSRLDVRAATKALTRLAQAVPGDIKVQKRLIDQHRWDGDTEKLIARLRHLLTLGEFPAEQAELSDILLSAERYDELIHWVVDDLQKRKTGDVAAKHLTLSEAYLRSGRFDQAIAELEEVLRLEPNRIERLRDVTYLLTQKGRYVEAISLYRKRLEGAPQGPHSRELNHDLGQLYQEYAEQLARTGRRKQAIALLRTRVVQDPGNVALRLSFADLHGKRVHQVAIQELRALLQYSPRAAQSLDARIALAERLSWTRDSGGAVATLLDALALAPSSRQEEVRRLLARHLLWANRPKEALVHYQELVNKHSSVPDLLILVDLFLDLGQNEEAFSAATTLRLRDHQKLRSRKLYARAAILASKFKEARTDLLYWTEHVPEDPFAWQLLSQCESELGHSDAALLAARKVQQLSIGGKSKRRRK